MTETGTIRLDGRLTVREVPDVAGRHEGAFDGPSMPGIVDLSEVEIVDSSALALLLDWQAGARKAGKSIRFEQPPRSLRVIARLTGVAPLLGWDDEREHLDEDES